MFFIPFPQYLRTVRPLLDDAGYARMEKLTREFQNGAGKRFQRYLSLKRFWATNYVSDWCVKTEYFLHYFNELQMLTSTTCLISGFFFFKESKLN